MKQLFRGGIHPNDGKALSRGGAPVPMPAPSRVIIPMSQHIGAPCTPCVEVGDEVLMGQVVGTPGVGFGRNGEGYFRLTAFGDQAKTKEAMQRMTAFYKRL